MQLGPVQDRFDNNKITLLSSYLANTYFLYCQGKKYYSKKGNIFDPIY